MGQPELEDRTLQRAGWFRHLLPCPFSNRESVLMTYHVIYNYPEHSDIHDTVDLFEAAKGVFKELIDNPQPDNDSYDIVNDENHVLTAVMEWNCESMEWCHV